MNTCIRIYKYVYICIYKCVCIYIYIYVQVYGTFLVYELEIFAFHFCILHFALEWFFQIAATT